MDKQFFTNTKHSSIRNHHTSNTQYNNNKNQQIDRPADTTTNYNDKQRNKTTNYRYSIKKQKSDPISNSHILLKNKTNKNIETTTTKNIVNQYYISIHTTTNNNNVPIATTTFPSYPKNYTTKIKQLSVTNPNNNNNKTLRRHNNGQNTKHIPPDSVLLATEPVSYNHRPINETNINTITPSKSIKFNTFSETTIQKIDFFPNTVATRRYHVDKPTYPAHTVTTTKQPEATDDST